MLVTAEPQLCHVLLVDDEVDAREAIGMLLDHMPDLVSLDARMPEMDGVSFLETLRSYLRWQNLPVLLLTAYPEGVHIQRAVELAVRKTLLKANCDMQELLAHVEACVAEGTQPLPPGH